MAKPTSDKVVMNTSADEFARLVQQASSVPDVRSELVDAYKSRVNAGHYPAQDVIEGFIHLMGGRIAHLANAGDDSGTASDSSPSPDSDSSSVAE